MVVRRLTSGGGGGGMMQVQLLALITGVFLGLVLYRMEMLPWLSSSSSSSPAPLYTSQHHQQQQQQQPAAASSRQYELQLEWGERRIAQLRAQLAQLRQAESQLQRAVELAGRPPTAAAAPVDVPLAVAAAPLPASVQRRVQVQAGHFLDTLNLPDRQPNVLFVSIPRNARGVMTTILHSRVAPHLGYTNIFNSALVEFDSCFASEDALRRYQPWWFDSKQAPGMQLYAPVKSSCLRHELMLDAKHWHLGKRPFTLTVMRHPLEHFASSYRAMLTCCRQQPTAPAWCAGLCNAKHGGQELTPEWFFRHSYCFRHKDVERGCSVQSMYMGLAGAASASNVTTTTTPTAVFDLVLVLERLEESLALLAIKLGLPAKAVYSHVDSPVIGVKVDSLLEPITPQLQSKFKRAMGLDLDNYRLAEQVLQREINMLSKRDRARYDAVLAELLDGNAALSKVCTPECDFSPYFSPCRQTCYRREICWRGVQQGW